MKKKITIICLTVILLLTNNDLVAQVDYSKPLQEVEGALRNVADNIAKNTTFKIINVKTGETYENSENLPVAPDYKVESPYNEWRYWNGVMNIGFLELGEVLKDPRYTEYAKKNVSFTFDHDNFFASLYEAKIGTAMSQKYRMSLLDDCGALGAGILDVYNIDTQARYRTYIDKAANYIMNEEKRLADGTFSRVRPYMMTVWGDDLYMSVPFLARMGKLTGEQKYFDEAARQVILFNKHLWDEQKQLYHHGWYDDIQQHGGSFWGRCNGWILMAQVELLKLIPDNHPQKQELIQLLTRQIVALSRYQDVSGLWHQLVDKENTYLETSSSAIYIYAIAAAMNEGWLDSRFFYVVTRGWKGIAGKILPDGQVEGISTGTGLVSANYYYATRPTPINDIHGLGPVLLAGVEVMKLYKNGISGPRVWGLN